MLLFLSFSFNLSHIIPGDVGSDMVGCGVWKEEKLVTNREKITTYNSL